MCYNKIHIKERGEITLYDIISIVLDVIAIGISIYALFKDNASKDFEKASQIKVLRQIILVQQINPNYNIHKEFNIPTGYNNIIRRNEDEIKNANWISKKLFQLIVILIYLSLVLNCISYFNDYQQIDSITDFTAIVYLPMRNTLFQLSVCLIAFSVIVIFRGWDKHLSKVSNLWSMKYYSFKIVLDMLNIISFSLVTYSFIEKVNSNIQHPIYLWSFFGLAVLFLVQILWIQFTIIKLTKISLPETNYEYKEKQMLTYFPAYIMSLVFFVLAVYTKFF